MEELKIKVISGRLIRADDLIIKGDDVIQI